MSCKDNFSLFELEIEELSNHFPIQINDELMSFASIDNQITPETNFDILLNKHLNNHEITDIQLQQLPEKERNALAQIQTKGKQRRKRTDECQKLFYKRAFKYSQHKFFKRCKNRSRKMSHFYHYHFDIVSQKQDLPITTFYHPNKKTKPGLAVAHKTFNAKYVKLLLKSKSFLEDIKEYHKIFIDDCIKQRQKKVISFTKSIQRIMERAQQDTRVLVKHLQSSQCKIPWTLNQIKETWELAQRDLQQFESCECESQILKDIQVTDKIDEQGVSLGLENMI